MVCAKSDGRGVAPLPLTAHPKEKPVFRMLGGRRSLVVYALSAACAFTPVTSQAEDAPSKSGQKRGGPKPPDEAYTACKGQQESATCKVVFDDREIEGSCVPDHGGTLFCHPKRPPGPPKEATSACTDKKEGDACQLTHPDGSAGPSGTCVTDKRAGESLICRPARPQR